MLLLLLLLLLLLRSYRIAQVAFDGRKFDGIRSST
jgi:hypothetical protein